MTTQPKLKRYDIRVSSKNDVYEILKHFEINIKVIYKSASPSYNDSYDTVFDWELKQPPSGLLAVYFKSRINPFNENYPFGKNEYTLDDLLKYEIAIEEAFVFWDANIIRNEIEPENNMILTNIFSDQIQNKEKIINDFLIKNNVIKEPITIKLGCYNATPNTGLVLPLPRKTLKCPNEIEIDAIYFDDGIRILSDSPQTKITSKSIEDLLQLSNGAKNIYLFVFNIHKRKTIINLPDSKDPYKAIRDWKRDNNVYNYEGICNPRTMRSSAVTTVNEGTNLEKKFEFSIDSTEIQHMFETENTIYIIICRDLSFKRDLLRNYQKQYSNWLNQCYIKYSNYYTVNEVRSKIGRSNKTLYDENGNTHSYTYQEGWIYDNWQIDGVECVDKRYYQFLDTTPPPKKPKELN